MRQLVRAVAMAAATMLMAASAANAQPPPNVARLQGQVTAVGTNQITVRTQADQSQVVTLMPGWGVQRIVPIQISEIQAGSFIGTANVPGANGTGRSVEVHVFPPGVRMGEGDYDWEPGTRMTNGDVGRVTDTAEGRQLEVRYPGGVRTVTVPPNTPITRLTPGTQADVRVGSMVNVIGLRGANNSVTAQFVGVLTAAN